MLKAGWEFIAHGVQQRLLNREENEAAVIEFSKRSAGGVESAAS